MGWGSSRSVVDSVFGKWRVYVLYASFSVLGQPSSSEGVVLLLLKKRSNDI